MGWRWRWRWIGREGKEWDGMGLGGGVEVPLLDFVEAGEEGDGDEDDDCFFAVADFELWVWREREGLLVYALPILDIGEGGFGI